MNLYTRMYASLLERCDHSDFRRGFAYTAAMLVLGVGLVLNLLSGINLLWALRVLHSPYGHGGLHPEHYVYALLCGGFIANTIVARVRFNADHCRLRPMTERDPCGPAYVLGSVVLFAVTLTVGMLTHL